ncbi:tyrosine-type recombinase/integrase [Bifidobacterium crudilactis]|jgi:integrase|uniref:tyrosine-type recombinase/integrase n=1 Tax=Bifidobacterium crudilactis TaxID=327277 RepID=UPI002352A4FD|nr:site-specific integrase [Bifidobacterium crudilactis]MCI1217959.1 site-specific integrase [Bifidobacterium crudilactis]
MGRTRAFGSLVYKPNKQTPTRIVASFNTPDYAWHDHPGISARQSRSFPPDDADGAIAWLNHERKLIEAGVWEPPVAAVQRDVTSRITLGEYYEDWLAERTYKGRPLKAGTRYHLRKDIENHIIPFFGGTRLIDITQARIDRWLATLPAEQETMKTNSFKALKAMLRTASTPRLHGEPALIPHNPCVRSLPKAERRIETRPATPEQIKGIYDVMPERYRMSVYLAVFGRGLRRGEVCALQRRDIDLNTRTLHIRRNRSTEDPDSKIGTPKTSRSVRDARIPSQLVPLLDHFLKRHVPNTPTAWLFPAARNPKDPIHPNGLRGMYAKARITVGRDDLRFHDLRHTGLTWMALDGATVRELMDSAGHADADTAMRYQHAIDERHTVLAEKLGERLLPDETPETLQTQISMIQQDIDTLQMKREGLEERLSLIRK